MLLTFFGKTIVFIVGAVCLLRPFPGDFVSDSSLAGSLWWMHRYSFIEKSLPFCFSLWEVVKIFRENF